MLREAALSDDVTHIHATLYRLAKDSKVVDTLTCAARNGKKVTVVIELLARFDEESNTARCFFCASPCVWVRMSLPWAKSPQSVSG